MVEPEVRARFLRMEPASADLPHSHDVAGEIFLVIEGQCEFLVEDERVTCDPGQLIYVQPRLRHTLHAVGDGPCIVYLSVTPHVEPTHTFWDAAMVEQPPRFAVWRGATHGDPHPQMSTAALARRYLAEARRLADLATAQAAALEQHAETLECSEAAGDSAETKRAMGAAWTAFRDALWQVRAVELAWNALAPRAAPPAP